MVMAVVRRSGNGGTKSKSDEESQRLTRGESKKNAEVPLALAEGQGFEHLIRASGVLRQMLCAFEADPARVRPIAVKSRVHVHSENQWIVLL